jgi:hypothetical protein
MSLVCLGSRYLDHISLRRAFHYTGMWFNRDGELGIFRIVTRVKNLKVTGRSFFLPPSITFLEPFQVSDKTNHSEYFMPPMMYSPSATIRAEIKTDQQTLTHGVRGRLAAYFAGSKGSR